MTGFSTELKMMVFPAIYFLALMFMTDFTSPQFAAGLEAMNTSYPDYSFVSDPAGFIYNATNTSFTRFLGFVVVGEEIVDPVTPNICPVDGYCFDIATGEIFLLNVAMGLIFLTGAIIKFTPYILQALEAVIPF